MVEVLPNAATQYGRVLRNYARIAKTTANVTLKIARNEPRDDISRYICTQVSKMGPMFIKFGQVLSTRGDVVGQGFASNLRSLQDDVRAIQPRDVESVMGRVSEFADYDPVPVAAASLGQVHSGYLKKTGERVAIKVKRPNLTEGLETDKLMIESMIGVISVFHRQAAKDLKITMNEFFQTLHLELDYPREVVNMKVFQNVLSDTAWIRVPVVYEEYSDEDVIVMEYIESYKIDDVERLRGLGVDCYALSFALMECFMKQAIHGPLFHGDPHPGNLGVTQEGQVVLYDYGMMCDIPKVLRRKSDDVIRAVILGDAEVLSDLMIECDVFRMDNNGGSNELVPFMEYFLEYTRTRDLNYDEMKEAFGNIKEVPFVLNPSLIMLGRAFTALEGVCVKLNPGFNLERVMNDYWEDNSGNILTNIDFQARRYSEMVFKVPDTIDVLKRRQKDNMQDVVELKRSIDNHAKMERRGKVVKVSATVIALMFHIYGHGEGSAVAILALALLAS